MPKGTSTVAKWKSTLLDALTQSRVNLAQKDGITTFGIGLGYDWTSPFSPRGNRIFLGLPSPPSLPPGPAGETTDQYNLRKEAHFKAHIVPIYKQFYEDLQTGFKLNAGWNTSYFEVIGGDKVDRDQNGVIDNYHRNRGYDATLGGTFTFAGAFALNMNWHKGDAYSSAKENEKKVPYTGWSGSIAFRIAVLNSKYETTEDYLKSLFIPSLILGASYEHQKVTGNESFAKDGITRSRVITPFLDFKINPKTQFRIGVPIKKYSGVSNETTFGPFVQYSLQLANKE